MGSKRGDCKVGCGYDHRPSIDLDGDSPMAKKGLMHCYLRCTAVILGVSAGLVILLFADMIFTKTHSFAARFIEHKETCMAMCHGFEKQK